MLADLADDTQWTEMAGSSLAGTYVGRQQIIEHVFAVIAAEWENFHFNLQALVDGGSTVVGIGEYSGICRKTGKAMKARVAHVWELAGGKVKRFEQFADTRLIALAME